MPDHARLPRRAATRPPTRRAASNGAGPPTSRRSPRASTPSRATAPRPRAPTASSCSGKHRKDGAADRLPRRVAAVRGAALGRDHGGGPAGGARRARQLQARPAQHPQPHRPAASPPRSARSTTRTATPTRRRRAAAVHQERAHRPARPRRARRRRPDRVVLLHLQLPAVDRRRRRRRRWTSPSSDGRGAETVDGHAEGGRWVSDRPLGAARRRTSAAAARATSSATSTAPPRRVVGASGVHRDPVRARCSRAAPSRRPAGRRAGPRRRRPVRRTPVARAATRAAPRPPAASAAGRSGGPRSGAGAPATASAFRRRTLPAGTWTASAWPTAATSASAIRPRRCCATLSARERRGSAAGPCSPALQHALLGLRPAARLQRRRARRPPLPRRRNVWVLRRGARATVLFKVRGGRVREVGLGRPPAHARPRAARRFLRTFS